MKSIIKKSYSVGKGLIKAFVFAPLVAIAKLVLSLTWVFIYAIGESFKNWSEVIEKEYKDFILG